jgi:hypothetical protein
MGYSLELLFLSVPCVPRDRFPVSRRQLARFLATRMSQQAGHIYSMCGALGSSRIIMNVYMKECMVVAPKVRYPL